MGMDSAHRLLLDYLTNATHEDGPAPLDLEALPEDLHEFGAALASFGRHAGETRSLAKSIAQGKLDVKLPPSDNELAAPLKSLHAALRHLTWQTQQVAKGDYEQRVDFMGDFSKSFNEMTAQLARRREALLQELEGRQQENRTLQSIADRDTLTWLYSRRYGMQRLRDWVNEKRNFLLGFADIDNLKLVNDRFGHPEGDKYILQIARLLENFSPDAIICRIGGDEFMLLLDGFAEEDARERVEELRGQLAAGDADPVYPYERSISYGLIAVSPENTLNASELLSAVDEKMYEYKRRYKRRNAREIVGHM